MTIVLGGREAGWCTNHDSRSPFFSLLSLNYSKAIISSSFHYQSSGANTWLSWGKALCNTLSVEALPDAIDPAKAQSLFDSRIARNA